MTESTRSTRNRTARHVPAKGMDSAARRVFAASVQAGVGSYIRARDLPGLIRIDPFVGIAETEPGVAAVVARLERALRAERNRARSGHWTYDLNRQIALRQAYLAERDRLTALKRR